MPSDAPIGAILLAGFVTFLTGAAFWKPAVYQQALPQALAAMAKDANRLRWIQAWMVVGVVMTTLGVTSLAQQMTIAGEHVWSTLGAACLALGALLMLVSLAFGLTGRPWAAAEPVAA